jgi:hypothetical protein
MNRSSEKPDKKKPYEPPKLLIYGNLTEMTQSGGSRARPDKPSGLKRFTGK